MVMMGWNANGNEGGKERVLMVTGHEACIVIVLSSSILKVRSGQVWVRARSVITQNLNLSQRKALTVGKR